MNFTAYTKRTSLGGKEIIARNKKITNEKAYFLSKYKTKGGKSFPHKYIKIAIMRRKNTNSRYWKCIGN